MIYNDIEYLYLKKPQAPWFLGCAAPCGDGGCLVSLGGEKLGTATNALWVLVIVGM